MVVGSEQEESEWLWEESRSGGGERVGRVGEVVGEE